jgi:hypothetical protein
MTITTRRKKSLWRKAPIAPIYQYTNGRLIKPWLKGYPITNPEDVAYSRTMYIEKHPVLVTSAQFNRARLSAPCFLAILMADDTVLTLCQRGKHLLLRRPIFILVAATV